MKDPVAKIVSVDTSKLDRTSPTFDGHKFAAVSFVVEIEHEGVKYNRKFTFTSHDEYIHHIGGPLTAEDVEQQILLEVDKIKSMHDVAAHHKGKVGIDMVSELKAKNQ